MATAKSRRQQAVHILIGASALLVAGCSGSGADGAPADAASHISFGEISPAPSHTPVYVAIEQGFFRKAGLDVSIQKLTGGTPSAMAAMATGSVDVMMAGATEFVEYSARKVISGKMVAELQDSTFDVVGAKGLTSIGQLKGQALGISGLNGGDHLYLLAVLRHYGLSDGDVVFITTGNSANRLTALASGSVKAIAAANSARPTSMTVGNLLLKSGDSPVQIPSSMIFASSALLKGRQDVLRKFVGALALATRWVKEHPDAAAEYCMRGSGASQSACAAAFNALSNPQLAGAYTWSATLSVNQAGVAEAIKTVARINPMAAGMTVDAVVDPSIAGASR